MKASRLRRPMQVSTFMRKEAVEVLRQPRLLLTMVLGPFLIMAAFGIGYRDEATLMRTIFVAPEGSPFLDQVEGFADELTQFVDYAGTTTDADHALRLLQDDDVDLVVTFPDDPLTTVLEGDRAPISVVHTRLDPIERTAIVFASRLAVDQINGQILALVVGEGQSIVATAGDVLATADSAVTALDTAIDSGDDAAVQAALDDLRRIVAQLDVSARTSAALTEQISDERVAGEDVAGTLDSLDELSALIADVQARGADAGTDRSVVDRMQELLSTVAERYDEFVGVDPAVLVRPFRSDVSIAVDDVRHITDWYAPAAVILMLQQFGVAFGALTFVRERQLGIVDVFRVAPVNAPETLFGKYLAYLLIGGSIGAVLTTLVVTVLDVPLAGSLADVVVVMALTLFASVGLGFVISLASATDAQAVQYTMITLLASLFFSGFFLALAQMEGVARVITYLLPVSYGMEMLRDVMLRGAGLESRLVAGLAAYGLVMFFIALVATHRRMSVSTS